MTTNYEHSINHAAQVTREWVVELARLLDWEDRQRAWRLLRVSLHAIRDWLDVNEASQLGAQLPTLIRGIYYEGWQPSRTPVQDRGKDAFLARIADGFKGEPLSDPEEAVCSVFRLLNVRISAGEVADVRGRLPKTLRDLWPEMKS
jgi:uncharacterized protein (DUF2267 family)